MRLSVGCKRYHIEFGLVKIVGQDYYNYVVLDEMGHKHLVKISKEEDFFILREDFVTRLQELGEGFQDDETE